MIQLVATEGELTVVRRLAGYCYGEWVVEWPESVPEEQRPELDDDRAHGYVHRLGQGSGRMGRRFVRADVTITAAEYDASGIVPNTGYTDVEDVLDAAVTQTDEDALVERAITRDGLGPWRPGTDFRVGDVVDVSVWGVSVALPVTSVEAVTEGGVVVDWRVVVGGQLVADDVERRRSNLELERAVWQERRERLGDVGRVSAAVSRAQSSADSAQVSADAARGEAQDLRDTLAGVGASSGDVAAQLEELNAQLQAHGEDPPGGLIPAYIAANTARWRLQDYMNDLLAWQVQVVSETVEWNQRYGAYSFAVPGFGKTITMPFLRVEVGEISGLSPNYFRLVNTSSDARLRVAFAYWRTPALSSSHMSINEVVLEPGRSYRVGDRTQVGSFIFMVTPTPVRAFVPSPPPAPQTN